MSLSLAKPPGIYSGGILALRFPLPSNLVPKSRGAKSIPPFPPRGTARSTAKPQSWVHPPLRTGTGGSTGRTPGARGPPSARRHHTERACISCETALACIRKHSDSPASLRSCLTAARSSNLTYKTHRIGFKQAGTLTLVPPGTDGILPFLTF